MKKINLYWWSEIYIQKKSKENYGDLLGKYLVKGLTKGKVAVQWVSPKQRFWFKKPMVFATIGSILAQVKKDWVVWGSGIISQSYPVAPAKFLAVRGPQTRAFLVKQGYQVPEVYGDPALLLPRYYNPEVDKKYDIGIIPHYNDYQQVNEMYAQKNGFKVIDLMTNDIEHTTREILSCKQIISSSLHGIIVPHAYGIPAVWMQFSNKVFGDGIKYQDYFESVAIMPYVPEVYTESLSVEAAQCYLNQYPNLPSQSVLHSLCEGLIKVCPFLAME